MFTGIITATSSVRATELPDKNLQLSFERPSEWMDLKLGESINTNGVCLTVATIGNDSYDCIAVPETLARTSFGKKLPKRVNLERALAANGRLDGHFVQGHVDGIGRVQAIEKSDENRISVTFDGSKRDLVVEKGSIAIDGVSLTVAAVTEHTLEVAIVPYTLQHSTLGLLQVGDTVNLEFDIIGKYVINSLKK